MLSRIYGEYLPPGTTFLFSITLRQSVNAARNVVMDSHEEQLALLDRCGIVQMFICDLGETTWTHHSLVPNVFMAVADYKKRGGGL